MTYKLNLLIPAAGIGRRLGLKYPKFMIKIDRKTILERQINLFSSYDKNPTIVINKIYEKMVNKFLKKMKLKIEVITQNKPKGMGDSVLAFKNSKFYKDAEDILLIWSDIPYLSKSTLSKTISKHIKNKNDFTFPTIYTKNPYTIVKRDKSNNVLEVIETRGINKKITTKSEREIGFFIFKKKPIYKILNSNLDRKFNIKTKEHNFLYIIKHLVKKGFKVEGIPIATTKDTYSINTLKELKTIRKLG